MNADVSFFTENHELVFSEKPYLALKMGNFVEGDKAVLVYREEASENELNKKNTGLKYIRVDQIEGYLKNIKIDERRLPVLAYAYYGLDKTDVLKEEKYYINESTYPKLTPEKVEYYTDSKYLDKIFKRLTGFMKNNNYNEICGYSDADWAGSFDRKSTTGFCTFVGGNLVT